MTTEENPGYGAAEEDVDEQTPPQEQQQPADRDASDTQRARRPDEPPDEAADDAG
jgi:hypothetical protein